MRKIFTFILIFCLNSCSVALPEDTKLLLNMEQRIFSEDRIVNYQIFDNGLIQKLIEHDSSIQEDLFKTSYKKLSKESLAEFKEKLEALKELDYHNDFPWKEDFSKRATVYKFQFIKEIKTKAFNEADSKTILVPTVNYFYSGLQEEPKLFTEIIDLVIQP